MTTNTSSKSDIRRAHSERFAPPMAVLSFSFLVLTGSIIQRVAGPVYREQDPNLLLHEELIFGGVLVLLWSCFCVEFWVRFRSRESGETLWRHYRAEFLACLIPPLRLALRHGSMDGRLWLPWVGWQAPSRELQKRLERFFSVPMIVVALMILPVLAVEHFWEAAIKSDEFTWLVILLDACTVLIWVAFATEFIVMVAVANNKWVYCKQHWLDLAIILLPLISFARALRLARLVRFGRVGRLYRLRGLAMRAFRAVLLLDVLRRIIGSSPEKRLQRLKAMMAEKELEVGDLRQEIAKLEAEIARQVRTADPPAVPDASLSTHAAHPSS